MGKITCNNPKLDHVNINAHTKFGQILLKGSKDNERKMKNYDERMNGRTKERMNGRNDRQPKSYIAPLFQSGSITILIEHVHVG